MTGGDQPGLIDVARVKLLRCISNLVGQCPVVTVVMGCVKVPFLLDTGSMVTTVTESFFKKYFEPFGGVIERLWLAYAKGSQWAGYTVFGLSRVRYRGYRENHP